MIRKLFNMDIIAIFMLIMMGSSQIFQSLPITIPPEISTQISQIQNSQSDFQSLSLKASEKHNSSSTLSSQSPKTQKSSNLILTDALIYHEIPALFTVGEVFQIRGKINETKLNILQRSNPRYKNSYKITLAFVSQSTNTERMFTEQYSLNETQFTIQCYFMNPDRYYMGIFLGDNGVFTPKIVQVLDLNVNIQEEASLLQAPIPFNIEIVDNEMYILYEPVSQLSQIEVSQTFPKNISQKFIISNCNGKFRIPYAQLKHFSPTQTKLSLAHANSRGIGALHRSSPFSGHYNRTVNATIHHFRQIRSQFISLLGKVPCHTEKYSLVSIKGKVDQQIYKNALVVEPNSTIIETPLKGPIKNKKYIEEQFELQQRIESDGIYIIEINHAKGFAIINAPIYVGDKYPLLPDYHDIFMMNKNMNRNLRIATKKQRAKYILDLINQIRMEYGVKPIQFNKKLNQLAQKHAEDMARHNYVSHKNRQGQSAGDRARKADISAPIGENIAYNQDLGYAQYGLTRSPGHLRNMIAQRWKSVGIGIAVRGDMHYLTQEFSTLNPS